MLRASCSRSLLLRSTVSARLFSVSRALPSEASPQEIRRPRVSTHWPETRSSIASTSIADEKRDYVLKIKLPHHIPAPEFAKLLKPYRVRHVDFRKGPKRYGNTFALVRFSNNHHVLFAAQRMEEEPLVSNGKKLEVSVVPAPPLPAALGFGLRSGVDPQDLDAIFRKMGTVEVIKIKQEHTFADNEWTCSSPNVTVHLRDAEQVSQATDLVKSVAEALIWVRGGKKSYVVDATTPESSTSANENIPPS